MATITLPLEQDRQASAALRTGIAFRANAGTFYVLCTLVWLAAPAPFLTFMNSLFHDIDFSPLLRPDPFSWSGFLLALVVMAHWSFLAGTFFGWLWQRLGR